MNQYIYPLNDTELADKDMLVAEGWTYLPNEKVKLIAPDGKRFIFMHSALEWFKELQEIKKNGIVFKVAAPYKGFGYGVWFRTANYKSFKLISIMKEKTMAEEWIEDYKQSPGRTLEWWNQWDSNHWTESPYAHNNHRVIQVSSEHGSDLYHITSYTDLVNFCIDRVLEEDQEKILGSTEDIKPLSFEIDNIPVELKNEAQQKLDAYNQRVEYNEKKRLFLQKWKHLRNLPAQDYKKYHWDFVDLVMSDTLRRFNKIEIIYTNTPNSHICKN